MCFCIDSFWSNLAATVVGGVILAILFFFIRERIFPLPKIAGRWYFEVRTVETSYVPYENMILRYVVMLWQEGHHIKGTAEKIYEDSSTGVRTFVGKNRSRSEVEGHIEKNYFGNDQLYLHMVEDGHGRESTHFYELVVHTHKAMKGNFSSMVANQSGFVTWQRIEF